MIECIKYNDFQIEAGKRDYFIKKIREWGKNNFVQYPWRIETNIFRILLTEMLLQKTDSLKIKNLYPIIQRIECPGDILKDDKILDYIVSKIGLSYKKERIIYISRQILDHFSGEVPGEYKALISLRGVGDYIANAVLTFGFKKKAALVDTNTIRIIESYFGYYSKKKRPRDDRKINGFLLMILPPRKYLIFSYYLLDFGSLVCTKRKKKCHECILKKRCSYYFEKK